MHDSQIINEYLLCRERPHKTSVLAARLAVLAKLAR
jgi:hypothetical protein